MAAHANRAVDDDLRGQAREQHVSEEPAGEIALHAA